MSGHERLIQVITAEAPILGWNVFRAPKDLMFNIFRLPGAGNVQMGYLLSTNTHAILYTPGDSSCIGFVAIYRDLVYVGHSWGNFMTDTQQQIVRVSNGGIVGGGQIQIDKYRGLFTQVPFQILYPPNFHEHIFNVAVVSSRIGPIPRGIYYNYCSF